MKDQTNPIVEAVAEALWQADSERAAGRMRLVPWAECPDQYKWRWLARAAILAHTQALTENVSEEMLRAALGASPTAARITFKAMLTAHMEQMK